VYSHALGQAHSALRLGHFRYERPWLKDERRRTPKSQKFSSGSDTTNFNMKTRRGVVLGRTPKERGGARSWGGGFLPPPKQLAPEHPLRRAGVRGEAPNLDI